MVLASQGRKILPNLAAFPLLIVTPASLYRIRMNCEDDWPYPVEILCLEQEEYLQPISIPDEDLSSFDAWNQSLINYDWVLAHLPRTLTQLTTFHVYWDTFEDASIWPSSLTSLTLKFLPQTRRLNCVMLESQHYHKLPRTLVSLHFSPGTDDHKRPPVWNDFLHQGIASISSVDQERWIIIKETILARSASLLTHTTEEDSSAETQETTAAKITDMKNYILLVEQGYLYGLPLPLERLTIDAKAGLACFGLLPPLSRFVKLRHRNSSTHDYLRILPPFLVNLELNPEAALLGRTMSLPQVHGLLMSSVVGLTIDGDRFTHIQRYLPPKLVMLTVTGKIRLTPHFAKALPRKLVVMDLQSVEVYDDDWEAHLPQSLTWLATNITLPPQSVAKLGWVDTLWMARVW